MLRTTDLDRLVTASATEELATHYGCHATHASMRFADKPAPFREAFSPAVRARRLTSLALCGLLGIAFAMSGIAFAADAMRRAAQ